MKIQLPPSSALDLSEKAHKLFPTIAGQNDEDVIFFQALLEEFTGDLDVMQQLKLFHAWCLDQHPTKIKNPRFRFRSWLANAAEYKNRKKSNATPSLFIKKSQPAATEG